MKVNRLGFRDYRNLKENELIPGPQVNVICGDNAQGKTNLLEAVWLFTGGRSFRGARDQELIAFYARTIARRRAEPLWRRGALALLAPHPDVLLVVRRVENGRDALGERAHNGCVLFAINRSQTPLTLLLDPNDPRLAPFARRLGEIALPPLTPIYFKA